MGTIQIKKVEKTVTTGKIGEERQKVKKTYGKIIYRGTLSLADMAEHIMKHGTVYTEDVVIGLADQSKKSQYKAAAMKQGVSLSTQLYSELTGEETGTTESGNNGSQGSNGGTSGGDNGGGNSGGDYNEGD